MQSQIKRYVETISSKNYFEEKKFARWGVGGNEGKGSKKVKQEGGRNGGNDTKGVAEVARQSHQEQ